MFTRNDEMIQARKILQQAKARPVVGTVLTGLKGLPVRIHCQIERGTQHDIFAYATMVHLMEELTTNGQQWYLRDFASQELNGTKIILVAAARDKLLTLYAEHSVLSVCDVLPVKSLRIAKSAESKRSMHAEIVEMVSDDVLKLCADYAEAAMDENVVPEEMEEVLQNFYTACNEA